jgi:tetratricopeptide (TPR) repeat protein
MSHHKFSLEWLNQFSDPYAVLGLSVAADKRRVFKRYHSIAKILHPDRFTLSEESQDELAHKILSRLVNPAYQQLKQEKPRIDVIAMLRFRARRLGRQPLMPQSAIARRLIHLPASDLETFYEQAIAQLAELQFDPIYQFEPITQQLVELNLIYLHLKMGEPMIREKRTGIMPSAPTVPVDFIPAETAQMANIYAQRHYQRAHQYAKNANWMQAIAELRDALRLEPERSEYHSLLAKVYWMQNLKGMARVHFRQALKFNDQDPLALEYAAKLKINLDKPRQSFVQKLEPQNFLGLFVKRR